MISQPMNGLPEDDILEKRNKISYYLCLNGYDVVDTYFNKILDSYECDPSLYLLGKSLILMSFCDLVFFCKDWEKARGCIIEHEAAISYDLDIVYETEVIKNGEYFVVN